MTDANYWGINGKISRTVASNNLTIAVVDYDGSDFSAGNPLVYKIGDTPRLLSASLSVTVNAGTNIFNVGAAEIELFVYLGWRASDTSVFVIVSRIPHAKTYADFSTTSTLERYGAYSGSAPASTDPVMLIGRTNATNSGSASYNWSVPSVDRTFNVPFIPSAQKNDGWIYDFNTWSYSSADSPTFVISINADMTGLIGVGNRIKINQTTDKYFIVTAVGAYSAGATLVTVYGGTDYTLANATISNPCYSRIKAPFGFPLSPAKWTVTLTDTSARLKTSPVANTYYNTGSLSVAIPIGVWDLRMKIYSQLMSFGTAAATGINTALSTSNNSVSDTELLSQIVATALYSTTLCNIEKTLTLATKTTYYVIHANISNTNDIQMSNDAIKLIVSAECSYL